MFKIKNAAHIYIYILMLTYIHTYVCVCVCVCVLYICVYIYLCVYVYTYMYICSDAKTSLVREKKKNPRFPWWYCRLQMYGILWLDVQIWPHLDLDKTELDMLRQLAEVKGCIFCFFPGAINLTRSSFGLRKLSVSFQ